MNCSITLILMVGVLAFMYITACQQSGPVYLSLMLLVSLCVSALGCQITSRDCWLYIQEPDSSSENDDHLHTCLFHYVEAYRASHKLLMGDFNYPAIDWSTLTVSGSGRAEKFLEAVNDSFLHQHVSAPTRYRIMRIGNTPLILDFIFTNEEHRSATLKLEHLWEIVIMLLWPLTTTAHRTQHRWEDLSTVIYTTEGTTIYYALCLSLTGTIILEDRSLGDMWRLIQNRIKVQRCYGHSDT